MPEHILIIDDEAAIRELLAKFLSSKGYRTTACGRAADALAAVETESPDLILCDLQLEDADGLELIAQLKRAAPRTPIILLTGVYFDPEVARQLAGQEVAFYLQKTAPLADVITSIRRLLPGRARSSNDTASGIS